jgi:hypothetical protein
VLASMNVAAGDGGHPGSGDPAVDVAPIEQLRPVDQRRQRLPLTPEAPCRSRRRRVSVRPVGMGCKQSGPRFSPGEQGVDEAGVQRDVLAQADRDGGRGLARVEVVVRELYPGTTRRSYSARARSASASTAAR